MTNPESTDKSEFNLAQFEPDVFWQQHGRTITWAVVALVAIGLIGYYWQTQNQQRAAAAAVRLAQAHDAPALEQIIRQYPHDEVGALALLRLSDVQFRDSKYDQAAAAAQQFLANFPRHAFTDSARLDLAAALEAQKKYEDARSLYSQIAAAGQNNYAMIAARLGVARCTELLGQKKEARQLYEELLPLVQNSPWQNEVYLRWTILGRDLPKEPTPAPGTTPLPFSTAPLTPAPAPAPAK